MWNSRTEPLFCLLQFQAKEENLRMRASIIFTTSARSSTSTKILKYKLPVSHLRRGLALGAFFLLILGTCFRNLPVCCIFLFQIIDVAGATEKIWGNIITPHRPHPHYDGNLLATPQWPKACITLQLLVRCYVWLFQELLAGFCILTFELRLTNWPSNAAPKTMINFGQCQQGVSLKL